MSISVFMLIVALTIIFVTSHIAKGLHNKNKKKKETVLKETPSLKIIKPLAVFIILSVIILPAILGFPPYMGVVAAAIFIFWRNSHKDVYSDDEIDENGEEKSYNAEGLSVEESNRRSNLYTCNIVRFISGVVVVLAITDIVAQVWFTILLLSIILYVGFLYADSWLNYTYKSGQTHYVLLKLRVWYYLIRVIFIILSGGLLGMFYAYS